MTPAYRCNCGLIDVHAHCLPPAYRNALSDAGLTTLDGGYPIPEWSAEKAIAVMEAGNIETIMLSVSSPSVGFLDERNARVRLARTINEDIAQTAVAVLMAPERHDGKTYRPTGPQLLSGREMAEIVAKVVGHRVRAVEVPFWLFSKTARWGQGVGPFLVSALRHYVEDVRNGAFAFEGGVTDTVEALTGTPAESFETTARRYAALPFARQSLGNRLKSLVKFSVMPLLPGYDLERLERQWGFPQPQKPTPSLADETWRREHSRLMAGQPRPGEIIGTPSLWVAS